eukprot:7173795-Prymnesium_polylepis.1
MVRESIAHSPVAKLRADLKPKKNQVEQVRERLRTLGSSPGENCVERGESSKDSRTVMSVRTRAATSRRPARRCRTALLPSAWPPANSKLRLQATCTNRDPRHGPIQGGDMLLRSRLRARRVCKGAFARARLRAACLRLVHD